MKISCWKKKIINEDGQSLVEFFVFLPFMLIMYSISVTISNAINGSINQQKIVRGYFFRIVQNDSMVPTIDQLNATLNLSGTGMLAFGWKEKFVGSSTPEAPCYKLNTIARSDNPDKCEDRPPENTTQFIRVKTAFGICSNNYAIAGPGYYLHNINSGSLFSSTAHVGACANVRQ